MTEHPARGLDVIETCGQLGGGAERSIRRRNPVAKTAVAKTAVAKTAVAKTAVAKRTFSKAAVVLALVASTLVAGFSSPTAGAAPASSDWLGELNLFRSMAGLPPVTHVSAWSNRNVAHAKWMVYNDLIIHGATPGTPWYSEEADIGGKRSNLTVSSAWRSNRDAIDGWMAVPFHGIGLLDPTLTRVGFGAYYDSEDSGFRWGAGLDILSDRLEPGRVEPPAPKYPIVWPKAGSTVQLTRYSGNELPDPLTSCPGYSAGKGVGLPLYTMYANQSGSVSSVKLTRISDGAALDRCWFDWTSYTNPDSFQQDLGRNVLGARNAVVVMPASPLVMGESYRLVVVRNGVTASTTFEVGAEGAPPPSDPIGKLEVVESPAGGKLRLAGWAADWDAPKTSLRVHTYVDGKGVSSVTADIGRSDVAAAWPELGSKHGFDLTLNVEPGERNVCVYALNSGSGSNSNLGCRDIWVSDPKSPFSDVLSSSVFFDSIMWVVNNGVAAGYPDGTFKPTGPVSRQAMARFMYLAAGSPTVGSDPLPFRDVGPDHQFRDEIAWMVERGIAEGYEDNTFRPEEEVTRQATAAFIWRFEGKPVPADGAPDFSDVSGTDPFGEAIRWLAGEGVATGYEDGTFRGTEVVARQHMAAFLQRWLAPTN